MSDFRKHIRVGDTPLLTYTIKDGDDEVDISGASTLELRLVAPSGGTTATVTPVVPSGSNTKLQYQSTTSTFDAAGSWGIAARISWSGGRRYETTVHNLHVDESQF
jgi:hypothetical protein